MDSACMERNEQSGVNSIRAAEYGPFAGRLQYIFLTGDLSRSWPHPFFRDARLEILVCEYEPGDHGYFHWHAGIAEYEFVLEGSIAYLEVATGERHSFRVGDLLMVPPEICVRRPVEEPCRTLAIKLPSGEGRIQCQQCPRERHHRVREFGEAA